MKLRKIMSLAIVAAIVMVNTVIISMPTVSAAANSPAYNTLTRYADTFDTYTQGIGNYTTTGNGLKNFGWYAADHDELFTNFSAAPYTVTTKFAQLNANAKAGDSGYGLVICSANEQYGTAGTYVIREYGYGKTFPGVAANTNASGSWEISFNFKPYYDPASANNEFAFTINTTEGPNNIVACSGTNMCLGAYDVTTGTTFSTAPINTVPLAKQWYLVKVFLNINQGYYSVELWNGTGTSCIARRSPISLNSTNVRFVKFSALGISKKSYVFVDNVDIKSSADAASTLTEGREKLIYSDDFSAYTGSTAATTAMTSETTGTSFFPAKYTPWRVYANTGTYGNYSVTDGVLRFGKQSGTEKSAMIYAIPGETIVNTTTARTRGLLNISFKVKPEDIKASQGFMVTLGNAPGATSQTSVFILAVTANGPKIMHLTGAGTVLNAEHWYTVNMTIDVVNRGIKFVVTDDNDSNAVVDDYVQAPTSGSYMTPTAVGEIVFRAGDDSGSYVFLDDVNISYVTPAPSIDTGKVVMTDKFSGTVSGTTNVTAAIDTITVPLGTIANATTVSDFTLVDNDTNTITCTGTLNSGNAYSCGDTFTLTPSTLLQGGKIYTLTLLSTATSVYGDAASPAVFTFTTTNAMKDLMQITSANIGGTDISTKSDITAGSTVNVARKFANGTGAAISGTAFMVFYGGGNLINVLVDDTTAAVGAYGTDNTDIVFDVPAGINMEEVDNVSIFLWDGISQILPYCPALNY